MPPAQVPPQQRPITDSPWFWLYLFATGALIALALIGPKYTQRQAQIETQYEGRLPGKLAEEATGPPGGEPTRVTLQPLYMGLAAVAAVGWIVFWRVRQRQRASEASDAGPTTASGRQL